MDYSSLPMFARPLGAMGAEAHRLRPVDERAQLRVDSGSKPMHSGKTSCSAPRSAFARLAKLVAALAALASIGSVAVASAERSRARQASAPLRVMDETDTLAEASGGHNTSSVAARIANTTRLT